MGWNYPTTFRCLDLASTSLLDEASAQHVLACNGMIRPSSGFISGGCGHTNSTWWGSRAAVDFNITALLCYLANLAATSRMYDGHAKAVESSAMKVRLSEDSTVSSYIQRVATVRYSHELEISWEV